MQIQTDYSINPYLTFASANTSPAASLNQSNDNNATESLEYMAFLRKASLLLSDPGLSTLKRAQVLNLVTGGQNAVRNAAMGELTALFYEIDRIDTEMAFNGISFEQGESETVEASNIQDEGEVAYHDQSGDAGVSFKYPVAINEYQAPLAVTAHEGEHIALARARALINDENITAYVSFHHGYDSSGRLVVTDGTTTIIITHPIYEVQSLKIGGNLDIFV